MKVASIVAVAAALVATAQAAITPMIVGGTEVPVGEKTWMVGLRQDFGTFSRCGGMLITPTKVLTTGHWKLAGYVAIGTHYKQNGTDGEQIKVTKTLLHPKYNEPDDNAVSWDYKILTFEKPSTLRNFPPTREAS